MLKSYATHSLYMYTVYYLADTDVLVSKLVKLPHPLRNENHLRLPVAKTTTYGLETIEYRGCLLWSTLPPEIKDSKSLSEFKGKIKKWDGSACV